MNKIIFKIFFLKYITFFLFFLLYISNTKAQTIIIQGSIIDSLTHNPLSYSNIEIRNINDTIINGAFTNEKGKFKIVVKLNKDLKLVANCIGYYKKTIPLNLDKITKEYEIGEIVLSSNITNLSDVTIEGQRQYMEQKFDRKVYNLNETKIANAKTILDLLRTLPGVTVDAEDNVRFKGAPAVIYVDDIPSEYIYPKIDMIPVANVNKIELIDASMRTGGVGQGGVINIKMKAVTSDGFSGVLNNTISTTDFNRVKQEKGFVNINYKKNKTTFFTNIYPDFSYDYTSKLLPALMTFSDKIYQIDENSYESRIKTSLSSNIGSVITINKNTMLVLTGGLSKNNHTTQFDINHIQNVQNTDSVIDKYSMKKNTDRGYIAPWGYMYFKTRNDTTDKEFSGSIGFNDESFDITESNRYNFNISNSLISNTQLYNTINTDITRKALFGYLYYNHPISKQARWNLSYNGWFGFKRNEKSNYYINDIINYPLSKGLDATLCYNTLSFRIGTNLKKWKLDGGLALQEDYINTDMLRYNLDNSDTLIKIKKEYLSLIPSSTISYVINNLQEIKFTYSRSTDIPWGYQFCGFIDKQDPRKWYTGNPNLKNIDYNNFYLGYSYNKEKWNFATDIFYNLTNKEIADVIFPYSSIILISMPENIAHKSSLGLDMSTFFSIKSKYNFSISSSFFHNSINANSLESTFKKIGLPVNNLQTKDVGYSLKFSSDITITKKLSGMVYVNYYSKEVTFNGYKFGYLNSSLSLTNKFFKDKLLMSVGIDNLFDEFMKHGSYYNNLGLEQTTNIKDAAYFSRTFFISLKYRYKQGDRNTIQSQRGN